MVLLERDEGDARNLLDLETTERSDPERFVIGIEEYEGNNPRLLGIGELRAIGALTPDPFLVLPHCAFAEWKEKGMTETLQTQIYEAFDQIRQTNPKRGIHVGFRAATQEGKELQGPRTSAIFDKDELVKKIEEAWGGAVNKEYDHQGAEIALCLHPFIHATKPPREDRPDLPWPGGDVILRPDRRIEIRAIPGADEATQFFDSDVILVSIDGPWDTGTPTIEPRIAKKTSTRVPGTVDYDDINIPTDYQEISALNIDQVIAIARVHKRLCDTFGPRRLEFIVQEEGIIFRECAPFDVRPEDLVFLGEETIQPTIVCRSEEILKRIEGPTTFVYLPPELLRMERKSRIQLFSELAIQAKAKGIHLVIFAWGKIAACHMVHDFIDLEHSVFFVGEEEIKEGELIKVSKRDGLPQWERAKEEESLVVELKDCKDRQRVGGKVVNLAILARHEFNVPQGFCVTTEAFGRCLASLGLEEKIRELDTLEDEELEGKTAEIQEAILSYEIPEALERQIQAELCQLQAKKFAARSSANIEDRKGVTFAGKFDTFLDTPSEAVKDKIKHCWTSAFSLRAVEHAKSFKISPLKIKMAVLIQEMVEGRSGGTIHTKDITTGFPNIIITAGKSAEAITSREEENPHLIKIERGLKRRRLGEEFSPGQRILSEDEIDILVDLALKIEETFGESQDIEWVIKNGKVVILQTRPLS